MSVILPEIALLKSLEGLLLWLKSNYNEKSLSGVEEKSYIYRLFHGVEYNGFNYYDQAKKILFSDPLDQRKLKVRIFFDQSRAHMPTVHIVMPGENNEMSGLGYNDDGEFFERQYSSRYALVLTSDNYAEVLILYYTVKSLIMSGFMTLEGFGIRDIKIGGGDLQLQPDMIPTNVFYRTIFIDMFYDEQIPNIEYDSDDIINNIYINEKLIVEGYTPPILPQPLPYNLGGSFFKIVDNINERNEIVIPEPPIEFLVLVLDATGDPSVVEGLALYAYNPTTSNYIKIC